MKKLFSFLLCLAVCVPCMAKDYYCHIDENGEFSFANQPPTKTELRANDRKIIKVDLTSEEISKYMECYSAEVTDSKGEKSNKPLNRKFKVEDIKDKTFDKDKKYEKKDLDIIFSVTDSK